jgi:tetratricopeptide (TPR) repeat protein
LYQKALATSEKALGSEHPVTATCIEYLAELHSKQHRYLDAESLYQRALAIRQKSLRPNHPELAETLRNYAALLRKTKRKSEANALDARAKIIMAKNPAARMADRTIDFRALSLKSSQAEARDEK